MKALWNKRLQFIPQALLILCCIALLIPQSATAQENNGRDANARPGAIIPNRATTVTDDLTRPCDQDYCTEATNRGSQETSSQAVVDDVSARTLVGGLSSFQIQSGAPDNSFHITETGNIGLGTEAPMGRFHIVASPGQEGGDIFLLDDNGNLEIGGLLTEASSRLLKEHFVTIDGQDVLDRLAALPITTWNYKTDDPSIRHMGPMAQDFYAAFGLGKDDQHIAPLDANGVALAGVQALYQHVQTQATHIATLEQQNAELLQRLQALEALVQQRDK